MGYFSARQIARHRAKAARARRESLTFKLKDGTTAAGPYPCRVEPHQTFAAELTQGDRTTAESLWDIYIANGITVQAFWRPFVTFVSGETAQYHVRSIEGPSTYEIERKIVCTKVV